MHMIPVTSSNINSVGYENNTLYVSFRRSGIYVYSGVPYNVFQNLLAAPSKGKYFATYIKHSYLCSKL